jgi:drug/metabolite transporter (DMT)-like permease
MVLVLAIGSALSLGVADYAAGETLRRDGRTGSALTYTSLASLVGVVVVLSAVPIARPEVFTSGDVLWAVGAGSSVGVALPLLMVGMARGPMAVFAPVLGLTSLAVPAVAGPILGDPLSPLELVGLVVAFPAAGLMAAHSNRNHNAPAPVRALGLALLTGALLGCAAVSFGQTHPASGIGPAVVAQLTSTTLLFCVVIGGRRLIRPVTAAVVPMVSVGVLSAVAVLLSVVAFQRGPVAIVAAVIGLAPGITVILAWFLAHEMINRIQLIGFGLGVGAVILFAVG